MQHSTPPIPTNLLRRSFHWVGVHGLAPVLRILGFGLYRSGQGLGFHLPSMQALDFEGLRFRA